MPKIELNKIEPPICPKCGKEMKPAYDDIAEEYTGYLWECECSPNVRLSMG